MSEIEKTEQQKEPELTAFDILKAFGEYINYDPEQHSFNLATNEYDFHRAGDNITTICDAYDPTGNMAVLYAKKVYMDSVKNAQVKLIEILTHEDDYNAERKMFALFNSHAVDAIEKNYIDAMNQVIVRMTGKPGIGERDLETEKDVMYKAIENVVKQLGKCHEDVYVNSGKPVGAVTNVSTKIHLFNYMADCVLTLQNNAPDGVYFCYVNNNGTADGYFAIMIKSNGNLFSINDRIAEAYIGQHTRSRNGRWSEAHKDIFPYEFIMTFSKFDYKGYANKYTIDESKLSFADLEAKAYIPIILAILCVMNGRKGKLLDPKKQVFLNTLIRGNLMQADNSTALIAMDKAGLIESTTKALDIHLDREKLLKGELDKKYTGHKQTGRNQYYVDTFGQDFNPETKALTVTAKNVLALADDSAQKDQPFWKKAEEKKEEPVVHAEFVGTMEQMERQVYYELKMDLAQHIRKNIKAELDKEGGITGVYHWYGEHMRANMENLFLVLAHIYQLCLDNPNTFRPHDENDPEWISHIHLVSDDTWYVRGSYADSLEGVYNHYDRNLCEYLCPFTGTKMDRRLLFTFEPYNWQDIEAFTGSTAPKILQNWRSKLFSKHEDSFYGGNPILDVVDAVDFLDPFEEENYQRGARFDYYIGFSKRGMRRLLKALKEAGGKYMPGEFDLEKVRKTLYGL